MPTRKVTLIANPKTGRYGSRRVKPIQELASQLESAGVAVDLKLTSGPGDATNLAAHAARNGSSDVIVAGGDGTINEAIQGLAARPTFSRVSSAYRSSFNKRSRLQRKESHERSIWASRLTRPQTRSVISF